MAKQTVKLLLSKVARPKGSQTRATLNKDAVSDYADLIRNAETEAAAKGEQAEYPFKDKMKVFMLEDGTAILNAGFHRARAYDVVGIDRELEFEIAGKGTEDEAFLLGISDNIKHGVRLTNEDKKHNLLRILKIEKFKESPNTEIARAIGASEAFVRKNKPVSAAGSSTVKKVKRGGKEIKVDTARIGKGGGKKPKEEPKKSAGKSAKPSDDGGARASKAQDAKELEFRKNLEKVCAAAGSVPGYDASQIRAAIESGSLPISKPDLSKWATTSADRIKKATPFIVGLRLSVDKAFAIIDAEPSGESKLFTLIAQAPTSTGAAFVGKIEGHHIIIVSAETHAIDRNLGTGEIVLKRKSK